MKDKVSGKNNIFGVHLNFQNKKIEILIYLYLIITMEKKYDWSITI